MFDLATAAACGLVAGTVSTLIAVRGQSTYARQALAQVQHWQAQNERWHSMQYSDDDRQRRTPGDAPARPRASLPGRLVAWVREFGVQVLTQLRREKQPRVEERKVGWVDGIYYGKHWPADTEHTTEVPRVTDHAPLLAGPNSVDLNVADHPTGNPFDHTDPRNDDVWAEADDEDDLSNTGDLADAR
jgi:hypothetical protein